MSRKEKVKVRHFNLENINPCNIYRVYAENNDLVLWYSHRHETRYQNLTAEEKEELIENLKTLFAKNHITWEVYNGRDEAKGDGRLYDLRGRRY